MRGLADISKPLRQARSSVAHGTQQEQQQVSSEQLAQWAEREGHGEEFRQLLSVEELFSQSGRPLTLNPAWPYTPAICLCLSA